MILQMNGLLQQLENNWILVSNLRHRCNKLSLKEFIMNQVCLEQKQASKWIPSYTLVYSLSRAENVELSLGFTLSSLTHSNLIPTDHQSWIFVFKPLFWPSQKHERGNAFATTIHKWDHNYRLNSFLNRM